MHTCRCVLEFHEIILRWFLHEITARINDAIESKRFLPAIEKLMNFHWSDVNDIIRTDGRYRIRDNCITLTTSDDDVMLVFVLFKPGDGAGLQLEIAQLQLRSRLAWIGFSTSDNSMTFDTDGCSRAIPFDFDALPTGGMSVNNATLHSGSIIPHSPPVGLRSCGKGTDARLQ